VRVPLFHHAVVLALTSFLSGIGPAVFGSIGSACGVFGVFWSNAALLGGGGLATRALAGRGAKPE
jgi:hypothetical protein